MFKRVIWIVLDSVGIGEMPDAADYGDAGSDTLGNIARQRAMQLPNLCSLGLANIKPLAHLEAAAEPLGSYGRCTLASPGGLPSPAALFPPARALGGDITPTGVVIDPSSPAVEVAQRVARARGRATADSTLVCSTSTDCNDGLPCTQDV